MKRLWTPKFRSCDGLTESVRRLLEKVASSIRSRRRLLHEDPAPADVVASRIHGR
jgi:hypothetical protein